MKRIVAFLLFIFIISTSSCSQKASASKIAVAFRDAYPLCADVYSSRNDGYSENIIDDEMLVALYGTSDRPTDDFAFILYGKVSTVREIGVFSVEGSDERMEVIELANNRLKFLSSFLEGEGFIRKYRGVIVYGFVDDAAHAQELLDSIL